jgi:hypothetical protein
MDYKKLLLLITVMFGSSVELQLMGAQQNRAIVVQQSTFKFLERIPWSLDKFKEQRNNLSEEKMKKIRERLSRTGNEKTLILFDMATLLPREVQEKIINCMSSNDRDVKLLFQTPIGDDIGKALWSYQVFRGGVMPWFKNRCTSAENWTPKIIAENAQDIMVYSSWADDLSKCCDRKMLESVSKVCNTFSVVIKDSGGHECDTRLKYAFKDAYVWDNFKKYQKIEQWILLPFLLFPFGIRWLAQVLHPDLSLDEMEKMTREHDAEVELNAIVQNKFDTTKDDAWLSLRSAKFLAVDEAKQNIIFNRMLLYKCSSVILGAIPTSASFCIGLCEVGHWLIKNKYKDGSKFWQLKDIFSLGAGLVCGAFIMSPFYFFGPYLCDMIERPIFGMVCTTGFYAAAVSLWNIVKMRTVRHDTVKMSKIAELLQRTDIEIV